MKLSSENNRILSGPSKLVKELPLIAQLSFKDLEESRKTVDITPIYCNNCNAV
ncbi:MAG: hypothetical protein ACTSWN_02970 [Promethearchaeota archaeon]